MFAMGVDRGHMVLASEQDMNEIACSPAIFSSEALHRFNYAPFGGVCWHRRLLFIALVVTHIKPKVPVRIRAAAPFQKSSAADLPYRGGLTPDHLKPHSGLGFYTFDVSAS